MNPFRYVWNSLTSWRGLWEPQRFEGDTHGILFGGARTKAGPAVNAESAMGVSAFFAGVRIITETAASLPLNVHRRISAREQEIAYTHPVQSVIHDTPNEEMTAKVFWQVFDTYRILWGNGLAEIEWDMGGNCRGLHLLEPWRVKPRRDDANRMYYEVTEKDREPRRVYPADMLHVPNIILGCGYWGISTLEFAREELGGAIAARDFGNSYFGNGGVPSGVLEHPGKLSDPARKNIRAEWNAIHSPAHGGTAAAVAVLQEGMKYTKIGLPPKDGQFIESMEFSVEQVSRWLKLPPHFLGDLRRATFSNIEELNIEFVVYNLLPDLVQREQEINRKLLRRSQHYSKHNVYGLLRGNMAAQSQFFRELWNIGVVSPNDIRSLMEMNPVAGGDQHFVQISMTTIDRMQEEIDARVKLAEEPADPPEPNEPPEPETEPEAEPDDSDLSAARQLAAHRQSIASAARRMVRKETLAAVGAASSPKKFLTWLDTFYLHHEPQFVLAITPAIVAALSLTDWCDEACEIAGELAANHCRRSREMLLQAAEVTEPLFAASVQSCVEEWEIQRANDLAASVPPSPRRDVTDQRGAACLPA